MWVSKYYHAPLGQILGLATPLYLRQGRIIEEYSYNHIKSEDLIERKKITLSEEQRNAVEIIKQSLSWYECFLLDGITGSGKTEVYRHIQNEIYKKGLQTLIIVPEKTLIPGLIKYFKIKNFRVAEYHSSLTPKQKFISWTLIQNCQIDIIIGTRSSVFLKIPNLGLNHN